MISGHQEETNGTLETIIRAIVLARGRDGATLQDIKHDYEEREGQTMMMADLNLEQWIKNINFITTTMRNGQTLFFSDHPQQHHIVSLIRKQRSNGQGPRPVKHIRKNLNNIDTSRGYGTPRVFENSIYKRTQSTVNRVFATPARNSAYIANITSYQKRPSSSNSFYRNNNRQKRPRACPDESIIDQNNTTLCNNYSSTADRLMDGMVNEFMPEYFKCFMLGDDMFMNLACFDLGFRMYKKNGIMQSGLCVSGLTIRQAIEKLEDAGINQIVLLNVGSTDIANGTELAQLMLDYCFMLKVCKIRNIRPILTTIAPLANYRLGDRAEVTDKLNRYIMSNASIFPVIDLYSCFVNKDGLMNLNYYQQTTRFVSGTKKPLVMWNKAGRQAALRILTKELGDALLKILVEDIGAN